MGYKMVVSDLDGTMFEGDLKIIEDNTSSIKKMEDLGLAFALASGRSPQSTLAVANRLNITENQYVICFNGAQIAQAVTGRIIYSVPLTKEDALYVIKKASAQKNTNLIAYINGKPHTRFMDESMGQYASHVGITFTVDENFEDVYTGEYNKIIIRGNPDNLKNIEYSLANWADGRVSCVYSSNDLLEYFNINASKGNALVFLAEKLNIKIEETIAIGDYYNDISMLKAAGLGVAITGSPKEVKAAAGYVTKETAGQGAVSEVIEKFVFGS